MMAKQHPGHNMQLYMFTFFAKRQIPSQHHNATFSPRPNSVNTNKTTNFKKKRREIFRVEKYLEK
jgi:hypothetical protein